MTQLMLLIELLIITVAVPSRARAGDASCKAVTEAMMKQLKTTYRQSITLDGTPAGEKIYTTTAFYYQGNDAHWIRVPMTTQERIDAMHETVATFSNCKRLREEMVDGQSATVYAVHQQTTSSTQSIDMQIWIATASGLALKTEADKKERPQNARLYPFRLRSRAVACECAVIATCFTRATRQRSMS